MPEIRAQLTDEVHRKLKAEAAHQGLPLKELVAKVLENYVKNSTGAASKRTRKPAK